VPTPADVLRRLRGVSARPSARLAFFALVTLVATWPLLATADSLNDFRDSQYFTLFEDAARLTVARFHQLPLWNPYYCGGTYLLGTPSARFVSPTFLLTLAFGVERADALIAFVMSVVGMEGVWRYARSRGASGFGAMLGAPAFALSGLFAHNPVLGWANFYSFELVPWAAFGLRMALTGSMRGAVLTALSLAWMIGHGGTYPAPMMLVIGAVELAGWLGGHRRWRKPRAIATAAGMAALAGLFSAGASLVRIWPVGQVLASGPRLLGTTEGHDLFDVGHLLFNGDFLVGVIALPVVLVAIARRRAWPMVVAVLLLLWIAMGYAAHPSIFEWMRKVPPYTMLRSPERFLALVALYYAALSGVGVRVLDAFGRKRRRARWLGVLACALLVANLVPLVVDQHRRLAERKLMAPPTTIESDFRQARGNRWLAAFYPGIGRGTLSCFDDYDIPQSAALRGDLPHDELLKDPAAGSVTRVAWSPNRIDLHVVISRPARVLVNQNWHPGWHPSVGTLADDDGRVAVDLPEGTHDLSLRFLPRSAIGGAATTVLALLACALAWRRWRGDRGPQGRREWLIAFGLATAPFLAAGVAMATMHEPSPPPPSLVTPAGDPIVSEPPEETPRLGAKLEDNITLEAVTVQLNGRSGEPSLAVELDWHLGSPVERGLGVFIHIEGEGMETVNIDHVRISGVAPLETFPQGVTLRDVVPPLAIPMPKKKTTIHVYVGLWRARGDGRRVKVLDGAGRNVRDDRIEAATFELP
jgi:hypothetical protein